MFPLVSSPVKSLLAFSGVILITSLSAWANGEYIISLKSLEHIVLSDLAPVDCGAKSTIKS